MSQEENKIKGISEIVKQIVDLYNEGKDIDQYSIVSKTCGKYGIPCPKFTDIILAIPEDYREKILPILKVKPVRTASGIAAVAVMCKPHRCPHIERDGHSCIYCPGGLDSDFEYSPQSYTGYEPTTMRAIRARYDPYIQTKMRLDQFERLGHNTEKVEFIVMGGTFMSTPAEYRSYFIQQLHDALSNHVSSSLSESVFFSEHSSHKCVGITIETRPDYCHENHIDDMLSYGCTRLEIGMQSVFEDVVKHVNRGHTIADIIDCFRLCKDAGYKVVAHMMPNLPTVSFNRDIETFRILAEDPEFRPDGLKIYPTLVMRGTVLYDDWKKRKYRSYHPGDLIDLLAKQLSLIPPWVRVYRIQRDIPMPLVTSGVEAGNLREKALKRMSEYGLRCRDIRTREVGIVDIHTNNKPKQIELIRRDYTASDGWETFLSYEDPQQDILIGLLRLRKCARRTFRDELLSPFENEEERIHNNNNNNNSNNNKEIEEKEGNGNSIDETSDDDESSDDSEFCDDDDPDLINHFSPENIAIPPLSTHSPVFTNYTSSSSTTSSSEDYSSNSCSSDCSSLQYNNSSSSSLSSTSSKFIPQSIVRELHVYGQVVGIHTRESKLFQHQGYGTHLLEAAERIAKYEHHSDYLAVIAGVGTRGYYRRLGYELVGPYMVKKL